MRTLSLRVAGCRMVACVAFSTAALCAWGADVPVKDAGGEVSVVEFYNAGLEHYFISADPVEVAILDGGAFGGVWKRTGSVFPAWDVTGAPAGTVPVCRFFGTDRYRSDGTRIGPNSHFYTADPDECTFVKTAFQSVASDGKSYPAWTFESNAFAVKLPIAGACPAGTQALYRSYNNGAHGDPNHHYSTNASALQAMPGWVFEGLVMCLPQSATTTAVGVASGAAASATIGAAGGAVTSADGKLTLTIPAGALAAATTIGIQPITNFAHGKVGDAYRATPDGQAFAVPVTLSFKYTDEELAGSDPGVLGVAFQTSDRFWEWLGTPVTDAAARTVSVNTSHFTDFSKVLGVQIRPPEKTVRPKSVVPLQVKICYYLFGDKAATITRGFDCELDQGPSIAASEWSVNGKLGGDAFLGTVIDGFEFGTYTAPLNAPSPPTVHVSARVQNAIGAKVVVASNITIVLDAWTGTATGINEFVTTTATVTWVLDSMAANVAVYKPSGVATATVADVGPCSFAFSPATHAIDLTAAAPYNTEGMLTVDYNATPATYHGYAFTNWAANMTSSCGPPVPSIGGGPWFGGSGNPFGREATGTVSPDGTTIQGSASDTQNPPATYTWKFTRQQP